MSTLGQFFSTGGETARFERVFAASGSFTCPVAGKYLVTAIGGGGGGGGKNTLSTQVGAGGGGGGMAQKVVTLAANDVITFVVGAGGAGGTAGSNPGLAGGTSTATATGLSLTANGGAGGAASLTASGSATAGGTASGGTLNVTGGEGSAIVTSTYGCAGGSVGIYGVSYSSHVSGAIAAAGVGGPPSGNWPGTAIMSGADLAALYGSTVFTTGVDPNSVFAAAPGTMFESMYVGATTINYGATTSIGGYHTQSGRFLQPRGGILFNQGSATNARFYPGPGCGGWPGATMPLSGAFCGAANYSSTQAGQKGGVGGGGGSGGAGGNTGALAGGNGGQGLVVIEWFAPI